MDSEAAWETPAGDPYLPWQDGASPKFDLRGDSGHRCDQEGRNGQAPVEWVRELTLRVNHGVEEATRAVRGWKNREKGLKWANLARKCIYGRRRRGS